MALSAAEPRPCILCGTLTQDRDSFLPWKPEQYGAPPGKWRVIIYPLCLGCQEREKKDQFAEVERRLQRDMLASQPERWN